MIHKLNLIEQRSHQDGNRLVTMRDSWRLYSAALLTNRSGGTMTYYPTQPCYSDIGTREATKQVGLEIKSQVRAILSKLAQIDLINYMRLYSPDALKKAQILSCFCKQISNAYCLP